jgi:hypothetical protein
VVGTASSQALPARAKLQGSRVSASRKTCSTCFPRCCLRSGFPTDPVTDDRYYSVPSAEPHHVHVGTDLCPSHGSPYCQYPVTPKPADRHPDARKATGIPTASRAIRLSRRIRGLSSAVRRSGPGPLGWTTVCPVSTQNRAGRCRRQTRLANTPTRRATRHPPRAPTSPDRAASRVLPVQTDPTHRSGQPQASLTPARQGTPTPRTGLQDGDRPKGRRTADDNPRMQQESLLT